MSAMDTVPSIDTSIQKPQRITQYLEPTSDNLLFWLYSHIVCTVYSHIESDEYYVGIETYDIPYRQIRYFQTDTDFKKKNNTPF